MTNRHSKIHASRLDLNLSTAPNIAYSTATSSSTSFSSTITAAPSLRTAKLADYTSPDCSTSIYLTNHSPQSNAGNSKWESAIMDLEMTYHKALSNLPLDEDYKTTSTIYKKILKDLTLLRYDLSTKE